VTRPPDEFEVRRGDRLFSVAAGTEVGLRYPANFDVLATDARWPLALVADGMGAGRGSTAAGRTTVDTVLAAIRAADEPITARALRDAVAQAQRRVRAIGAELGVLTGCTLTGLLLGEGPGGDEGWIVQIGDSRAYRLRGQLLELLTIDHTAAWLGAINGWYPADSPAAAAARYHLHRYVGHPDQPEPDVLSVAVHPGDVFCVCSDGLAEQVSYEKMAQLLGGAASPGEIVSGLLAEALDAGGNDNTTVAVVRVG
jgi:serine/threonine protein phosphatase PrpC